MLILNKLDHVYKYGYYTVIYVPQVIRIIYTIKASVDMELSILFFMINDVV